MYFKLIIYAFLMIPTLFKQILYAVLVSIDSIHALLWSLEWNGTSQIPYLLYGGFHDPCTKYINDTSANFLGMLSCCGDESNSIYLHIFVYIASKICPCQPTKPPMLLSFSCLHRYMFQKRYQKAITIMVLTLYCVNVAHPVSHAHNMGN